jgi:4-amino-4-deoxy-L-arabinose transferase-like glycosyltransferase
MSNPHTYAGEKLQPFSPSEHDAFTKKACIVFATFFICKLALFFVFLPLVEILMPGAYHIQGEPDLYAHIAWNVAQGLGFRVYEETSLTLLREPGYVYLLAGVYTLFGKSMAAAQGLNIVLSFFSSLLLYQIARNASLSRTLSLTAACLFLANPAFIAIESRASLEATFAFFMIAGIYAVQRAEIKPSLRSFALAGLILGAAVLVRSTVAVFCALVPLYWLYRLYGKESLFALFKKTAVYCACLVMVISVWTIRNYSVTEQFVAAGTVAGDAFYQGWFTTKHRDEFPPVKNLEMAAIEANKIMASHGIEFKDGFFPTFYDPVDEVRRSKILLSETIANYSEEPFLLLETIGRNIFRFWFFGPSPLIIAVNVMVVLPYLALFLVGAFIALRRNIPLLPPFLLVGSIYFVNLFFITLPRHHTPGIPFMCLFMALGAAALFPSLFKKLENSLDPQAKAASGT